MKHILVHLDASPRSAMRVAWAQHLARQEGAALTALYGVLGTLVAMPFAAADPTGGALSVARQIDQEQRDRARALFDRAAIAGAMTWSEVSGEPFEASLTAHALWADLLVLGQFDPQNREAGALPPGYIPTLIADSGKPALVLPHSGAFAQPEVDEVLLAWKPTREAARALDASLPWLRRATRVHACCAVPAGEEALSGAAALERWLRIQGVDAPLVTHAPIAADAGESLLSLAADTGAGLLVMGCYGHSRAREWVLGGATRTVLESMTLPVLLAH